ncbi:CinA family protein [Alloalcanivorax xenomutans]|tara:strand:+ start:570 stop:1049 length:480 start_codon:yes stop_codon:yes gene_type:complete
MTIPEQVTALADTLRERGLRVATAESCTGGGIAREMTELAGSSDWFECGFITYSNEAKQSMLGVSEAILASAGAVSEQTVLAMARGALGRSRADLAVAVSGVAGPGGGSADKPVGTVWIAWAQQPDWARAERFLFDGDRGQVRHATIAAALEGLLARLE